MPLTVMHSTTKIHAYVIGKNGETFSISSKNIDRYANFVMCAINYSKINDHTPNNLFCFILNFLALG